MLTFLVDAIAKYEEKDTVKAAQLTLFQLGLLKSMRAWTARPWLLPQFQGPARHPLPLKPGRFQEPPLGDPRVRTAKIKRVFEVLHSPSFKEHTPRDIYQTGGVSLKQIHDAN